MSSPERGVVQQPPEPKLSLAELCDALERDAGHLGVFARSEEHRHRRDLLLAAAAELRRLEAELQAREFKPRPAPTP